MGYPGSGGQYIMEIHDQFIFWRINIYVIEFND